MPFGGVAQLVEQRTENPCVASSTLALTTLHCPTAMNGIVSLHLVEFTPMTSSRLAMTGHFTREVNVIARPESASRRMEAEAIPDIRALNHGIAPLHFVELLTPITSSGSQ